MTTPAKKFNETVAALLPSNKDPENTFYSIPLDDKAVSAAHSLKVGDTLIFKKTTRTSKNGKQICFLEIMNKELFNKQPSSTEY